MSKLRLSIFDGTRELFPPSVSFLVTVVDGNQTQQIRQEFTANVIDFDLPFFDNFGDLYTVNVFADNFKQAGFAPVKLSNAFLTTLDIMVIPNHPHFNFTNATFAFATAAFPFLNPPGLDPTHSRQLYEGLIENNSGLAAACLLNLGEAMNAISLSHGTPVDYIKQVRWDRPPQQDRFFAFCDAALVEQVRMGAAAGLFAVESDPGLLHPGATSSWKQVQFGEANVQLTFHEDPADRITIDGVDCVTFEPDMDYFLDPLAHILLEVIYNALTRTLTDPAEVYVLRWIAGRTANVPEFAPLYTIV